MIEALVAVVTWLRLFLVVWLKDILLFWISERNNNVRKFLRWRTQTFCLCPGPVRTARSTSTVVRLARHFNLATRASDWHAIWGTKGSTPTWTSTLCDESPKQNILSVGTQQRKNLLCFGMNIQACTRTYEAQIGLGKLWLRLLSS